MPAALFPRLARLERLKTCFGSGDGGRVATLLRSLGDANCPDAVSLIRFHDAVLFIRAHPHSPAVLRLAERLLASVDGRVERLRNSGADLSPMGPEDVSGIAGTAIEDTLNYDVTRWLARRFPRHISIDWSDYEEAHLAPLLTRFIPLLEEDSLVEADVPYRQWLEAARGRTRELEWLLRRIERLPLSAKEKSGIYEAAHLPLRWELDRLAASRTLARHPGRNVFYHRGPLIQRRQVSLAQEFAAPPPPVKKLGKLSPARGAAILDLVREALGVRYRELWGTTRGDPYSVLHSDIGRGTDVFLWGLPPQLRLPLRAYFAGLTVKNGVPINYIEAIGLFEWVEVGFNTFYAFREGETAWIYAKVLRLLNHLLGAHCISVYPYQIGLGNEEAIQSGAFWFYRKLGFRPGRPELLQLTEREERRIASTPGYRTPARTLGKLATGHIFYELPGAERGAWDRFQVRHLGFAVNRLMARKVDGDPVRFRAATRAALARSLAWPSASAGQQRAFDDFAAVLALVPSLPRWSREEKQLLAHIIRSKTGPDELSYLRLLQQHSRLRHEVLRLGSK